MQKVDGEPYLMMWTDREKPVGMRKHVNANMQYARKSLEKPGLAYSHELGQPVRQWE